MLTYVKNNNGTYNIKHTNMPNTSAKTVSAQVFHDIKALVNTYALTQLGITLTEQKD